jgi:hypothetical protein
LPTWLGAVARLRDAQNHQRALDDLTTLAIRDLLALWATLDTADALSTSRALQDALPDLVNTYGAVAATLAADFYEDLRADAVGGSFTAVLAAPSSERTLAMSRWAAGALFSQTPDAALTLSRLSGGVQRGVAGADRDTIAASVGSDPLGPRYARHASGNACAFCALVATRGPVYRSEDTAGGKYHDHCHCVAVPVWPGQDYEAAPYVKGWDKAYREATRDVGSTDTSKVLARMREALSTN